MITLRKTAARGAFDHGWLRTWHSFSFGDYHDPDHMGIRSLRVLNEDFVAPGTGFPTHPHRDMEILTYVLSGALRHQDSMGNGSVIRPGDVQIMSAGTGVFHSEHNASADEEVHLLQIWLHPDRRGLPPRYDQEALDRAQLRGRLLPIAAPPGEAAVVPIFQDARILATVLDEGMAVEHRLAAGRGGYVHVARGAMNVAGQRLSAGDALSIEGEEVVRLIGARADSEALLFDLA